MDMITVSAKTLDEAITKALIELQTTSEHLHYEIIQKESSGFLGLFGAKPCVIRARVMGEEEEKALKKAVLEKEKAEKAAARAAEKPVSKPVQKSSERPAEKPAKREFEKKDSEKRESDKKEFQKRDAEKRDADKKETDKKEFDKKEFDKKEFDKKDSDRKPFEKKEGEKKNFEKKNSERRNFEKKESGRKDFEKKNFEKNSEKNFDKNLDKNFERKRQEKPEAEPKAAEAKPEKEQKAKPPVNVDEALVRKNAKEFLEQVFGAMGMQVVIDTVYNAEEGELQVMMAGDDMGILIGKRGQTLDSLQYLVSLVVNKETDGYLRVKLDTENYRERRKETLETLAKNISYKVKRTKRPVSLEPMNPYERRIIHSALQNDRYVVTRSEGEDPYRHVVISLKRDSYNGGGRKDRYNSRKDRNTERNAERNRDKNAEKNFEKNFEKSAEKAADKAIEKAAEKLTETASEA